MKAFPNLQLTVSEMGQVRSINEVNSGMDLRDYFAAKAMQSVIGLCYREFDVNKQATSTAKVAYKLADAMMKVRNK